VGKIAINPTKIIKNMVIEATEDTRKLFEEINLKIDDINKKLDIIDEKIEELKIK